MQVDDRPSSSVLTQRAGWLVVVLLLWLTACAREPESPLWADPGIVRLDADHTHALVLIHNRTGTIRPVSGFTLDGPDWGSLRIVDESLPRTIPAHDAVHIELELSRASLQLEPGRYRSGSASLHFASNQFETEVPIALVGSDAPTPVQPLLLTSLALLAVALGCGALAALKQRQSASASASRRLQTGTALAACLLVAAMIPVGVGACGGRLAALVGPLELAQCRAGLGGAQLIGLPSEPIVWWWLLGLSLMIATRTLVGAAGTGQSTELGPSLALAGLRTFGLMLVLAALLIGLAPADGSASTLVLTQNELRELFGLRVPRWGLLAQPLGACLGLALLAVGPTHDPARTDAAGLVLERFELLLGAAVLTTAFLGGPSIPYLTARAVPLLTHGSMIALELLAFVVKLGAVLWLVAQTRALLRAGAEMTSAARLVSVHARWTIPLALAHLGAVLLWRAL